jgi:hypothetical protein
MKNFIPKTDKVMSLTNEMDGVGAFYRERRGLAGVSLGKLAGGTPALPGGCQSHTPKKN